MIYIFFRNTNGEERWYPVELTDDEEARRNAECNPGTVRVETLDERKVWERDKDGNHVLNK